MHRCNSQLKEANSINRLLKIMQTTETKLIEMLDEDDEDSKCHDNRVSSLEGHVADDKEIMLRLDFLRVQLAGVHLVCMEVECQR